MPQSITYPTMLTIGGVGIRIHSDPSLPGAHEDCYQPFLRPPEGEGPGSPAIDLTVLDEPAPELDAPRLFDSDGAWTMQAEGDGYRLSFRRTGGRACHTIVSSDAGTTHVRVYVHQDADHYPPLEEPESERLSQVRYPIDQLLLMNHLALAGGIIMHGAGVVLEGRALVMGGVSGAGKSTIAKLLSAAGWGDALLSDDRIILRTAGGAGAQPAITAWGTPWPGDAHVARNAAAPLVALLFLVKSDADELVQLTATQAAERLMRVVSCPWYDPVRMPLVLDVCSQIVESTPCYDLRFRPGPDAVKLLVDFAGDLKGRS
jgi:hypothetical protein